MVGLRIRLRLAYTARPFFNRNLIVMENPSPARACGIDFGTSNSTVGWIRPGEETLIALEDVPKSMPQARAEDGFSMTIRFRLKNGRAVYASRRRMRRPTIC